MKKELVFILSIFLLIFVINGVLAISANIKETYLLKETMTIKIYGNILEPITLDDIEFKRGHVTVPFEDGLEKLGNDYYIWAIAQEKEGNYTLFVKDISTNINGINQKIDYSVNFSILGNLTDYYVKPGAIFARDYFEINTFLNGDKDKTVSIDFPSKKNVILKPGNNFIGFPIDSVNGSKFIEIKIGKYSIPSYIIGKEGSGTIGKKVKLVFNPDYINTIFLVKGGPWYYKFEIRNEGDNLENVGINYNKNYFEMVDNISIPYNETRTINLTIRGALEENINDEIIFIYQNYSFLIPVIINFTNNAGKFSEYVKGKLNDSKIFRCFELNGDVCENVEVCSGKTVESLNGPCCIEQCIKVEKMNGKAWIGYLLGAILIVIGVYVFLKYKKAGKTNDPIRDKMDKDNKFEFDKLKKMP